MPPTAKPVVMQLWGSASTGPTPYDSMYLKSFDIEAHDGLGEINMTVDIAQAMKFESMAAALDYYRRSPVCRPLRPDGKPNRPLTATNWSFITLDEEQS